LEPKLYDINLKTNWGFKIWNVFLIYSCISDKKISFGNHVFELNVFQSMVIEMLFNNKIQIIFFWTEFIFWENKLYSYVHYWNKFMRKISIISFEKKNQSNMNY